MYIKTTIFTSKIILFVTIFLLISCGQHRVEQVNKPTMAEYSVGEKWTWKYKGQSSEGEVRSNGIDIKEIVDFNGGLGMTIGNDTLYLADVLKPTTSKTPRYKWPLKVGKKWTYKTEFTSADGSNTGTFMQDAEVVSYQKVTVEAGTFMAYTIEYKGEIKNSRGQSTKTDDVWVYAPEVKNFIKMTQIQDGFLYNEELVDYLKPAKK